MGHSKYWLWCSLTWWKQYLCFNAVATYIMGFGDNNYCMYTQMSIVLSIRCKLHNYTYLQNPLWSHHQIFSTKRVIVVEHYNYIRKKFSIGCFTEKSKSNFNMYPIISKLINRSRTTYHTKPLYISYKFILVTHLGNTLIISYFSLRTSKWVKLSGKTAIFRWPYLRSHTINNPKFLRVLLPHHTLSMYEISKNSDKSPV